jgi:preprotein translocase subunit SecG
MENVVLIIHLILALCLIGVVLLQRSEGGGLGMGGGGGGAVSARGVATALGKLTWGFAIAFIATSIALTVIAAQKSGNSSVVDRLGVEQPATTAPATPADPAAPAGTDLLPPTTPAAPADPLAQPRAD